MLLDCTSSDAGHVPPPRPPGHPTVRCRAASLRPSAVGLASFYQRPARASTRSGARRRPCSRSLLPVYPRAPGAVLKGLVLRLEKDACRYYPMVVGPRCTSRWRPAKPHRRARAHTGCVARRQGWVWRAAQGSWQGRRWQKNAQLWCLQRSERARASSSTDDLCSAAAQLELGIRANLSLEKPKYKLRFPKRKGFSHRVSKSFQKDMVKFQVPQPPPDPLPNTAL